MIYYLPIEHEPTRYTEALDRAIVKYFTFLDVPFTRIYPSHAALSNIRHGQLPTGCFLNAPFTTAFKAEQLSDLAGYYSQGVMRNEDIIFVSDMWFPGIEAVGYLNHFCKVRPSLRGIMHAGSFTDTDEVRNMERWAVHFETAILDLFDRVFVGSPFMAEELRRKRTVERDKVYVTPFPLDWESFSEFCNEEPREDIVIFNGRNHPEKQPELFRWLEEQVKQSHPSARFVWTQEANLSKRDYHKLLSKAKCVVSFALQENFGFGVAEATALGCIPVVPDRLAYRNFYPEHLRYRSLPECVTLVLDVLRCHNMRYHANVWKCVVGRIAPNIGLWFEQ